MKKLLLILAVLLCASFAQATTLTWDEVPDTEDYTIAGYVVYFSVGGQGSNKQYAYVTAETMVEDIESTLNLIPDTTYNFAVAPLTTHNILGESSPEFEFTCGPRPAPENNLPSHIYIPGPIILSFESQP